MCSIKTLKLNNSTHSIKAQDEEIDNRAIENHVINGTACSLMGMHSTWDLR